MGLREEKKEQLRRDILDAAVALFRERGYDATRVQDIIERVRVSEGTFFNYFPTKDSLLDAFALDRVERYRDLLRQTIDAVDRSVPERIRDLLRVMAAGFEGDREFMAVVARRSQLFFGAEGAILEQELLTYDLLTRLFQEGQDRHELRANLEPLQLAEVFTGIYSMTLLNWVVGWREDPGPLEPRLMRAADVFLDGCRLGAATGSVDGRAPEATE